MVPKIKFIWSDIYQEKVHLPINMDYNHFKFEKDSREYISKVIMDWAGIEKEILSFMAELVGLKWKSQEISCYYLYVSPYLPISDPLTISISLSTPEGIFTLSKERFIDMLIHELIHNLFIQNKDELTKYFEVLLKGKYGSSNIITASHIPLHAVHEQIFLRFFAKERFDEEIEISDYYPEYKESWDIVKRVGGLNIIKDIKESVQDKGFIRDS
jgi:hypothetical protein